MTHMPASLRGSDASARRNALEYLNVRDQLVQKYDARYPGKLPRRIARTLHNDTLRRLRKQ